MPISVRSSIQFGWQTFKERPWFLVGTGVLLVIIHTVLSLPDYAPAQGAATASLALGILSFVAFLLSFLVDLGTTNFMLRTHDNVGSVQLRDLWRPDLYWRYLGAVILVGLSVLGGLILLIIPGIIFALALSFASILVVDRGLGPIAAMKESMRLTKGYRWRLLLFFLALILLNVLGVLLLLVGLLVTMPISALAWLHIYRAIEKEKLSEDIMTA